MSTRPNDNMKYLCFACLLFAVSAIQILQASQVMTIETDGVRQAADAADHKTNLDASGFIKPSTLECCDKKLVLKLIKNILFVCSIKDISKPHILLVGENTSFLLLPKRFMRFSYNYLHQKQVFADLFSRIEQREWRNIHLASVCRKCFALDDNKSFHASITPVLNLTLCSVCQQYLKLINNLIKGKPLHFNCLSQHVKNLSVGNDGEISLIYSKGFMKPCIKMYLALDRRKPALYEELVNFLRSEFYDKKWTQSYLKRKKRLAKRKKYSPFSLDKTPKSSSFQPLSDVTEDNKNDAEVNQEYQQNHSVVDVTGKEKIEKGKESENKTSSERSKTDFILMIKEAALRRQLEREGSSAYLCITLLMCLILFSLYAMRGFHSRNAKKKEVKLDEPRLLTVKEVLLRKAQYLPMFKDDGLEEVFVHDCGTDP